MHYNAPAATVVHAFKYERRMEIGRLIGDIMVARLTEPLSVLESRVKWIVPVPLHWTRRMWRGFNQSEVLATRLAESTGLPLVHALRRTRRTRMQTRIPRSRREANVAGAFAFKPLPLTDWDPAAPAPGVLLVDDVVTTGHTVTECARVLLAAGAPQVWIASFARA